MAKEMNKVELLKASMNPLDVMKEVYAEAEQGIAMPLDHIDLLKWYGMYPHRKLADGEHDGFFMKRIKLIGGIVTAKQLKVLADIGEKYANGYVDFTTRQNIQLHYIKLKDMPQIISLLDSVGLTSKLASGDGPRPISSCAAAGLDTDEIYDATELIRAADAYFIEHADEFSNLPRKYKLGISGCGHHCMKHEIQDVSLVAFKDGDTVAFDLLIGGGLSRSKAIAQRAERKVTPDQVLDVVKRCGELFRENGNRDNRNKARIRHLLADWGIEKFIEELESRLGYTLAKQGEEPVITKYSERHHLGIHKEKRDGFAYLGCTTRSGRVQAKGLQTIYTLVQKYKAEGIRLTPEQNFIFYGVPIGSVEDLREDLDIHGFTSFPSVFESKLKSCTGLNFCKFALTETKNFSERLTTALEKLFPDFSESISIAVSGCAHGCSHPMISDIGLIGCKVEQNGAKVEGYELFVGGMIDGASQSHFAESTGIKVVAGDVTAELKLILEDYLASDYTNLNSYLRAEKVLKS